MHLGAPEQMFTDLQFTAIRDELDTLPDQVSRVELNLREEQAMLFKAGVPRKDERRVRMDMLFAKFWCERTLERFDYNPQPLVATK